MPVQIGWLEMGWQLRPNEVEGRERGRHDQERGRGKGKGKEKKSELDG